MSTTQEKNSQQHISLSIPLQPTSTNTLLKGTTKDLGKYQFSFDQRLGSGLTSDAYLGRNKQTQELVCVKIIDLLNFKSENQKQLLENEIRCHQNVKSDHIVNFLDIYKTNSFFFIITELCEDGDLFKLIKYSRVGLPEKLVVRFAKQLAQALAVLKNNKIIHRDIKSENILLNKGFAKLGDFGFSIQEKNLKQKQNFSLGSPLYMPLEALEEKKYGYQSDIFSYGIVLYEMLHGESPWECSDEQELKTKMKTQEITFKTGISEELKEVIKMCLQRDSDKRGKVEDILNILSKITVQELCPIQNKQQETK